MSATFWLPAIVRALATALLVVSASALAEALGPFWGALIASLPVSSGPAYVFLAMRHDDAFVAASALSSCAANAATGLFLVVYGLRARQAASWSNIVVAIAVWLLASVAIRQVGWTHITALLLNLVFYGVGLVLVRSNQLTLLITNPAKRRWFELPVRAAAVAGFVTCVVLASSVLGPVVTGSVAVFPISLCSILVILESRIGGHASSLVATSALVPMLGFGVMLLALHLATLQWGAPVGLSIGLLVSAVWSGAILVVRHWWRAV